MGVGVVVLVVVVGDGSVEETPPHTDLGAPADGSQAALNAAVLAELGGDIHSSLLRTTTVKDLAEAFPEAFACTSYDVAPEFREFERMSTTVVNAYLGPVMQTYIRRLAERLTAWIAASGQRDAR